MENAQTKEEAKNAIREAGMLLDDDELEMVSGGGMEKTEDKYLCIYCEKMHEMERVYPSNVYCNGVVYSDMERYLCTRTSRTFYVKNVKGKRYTYNDKFELKSIG